LSKWLAENECTHVAMEATGVYWKPVWHILDDGEFTLLLANAAHVKNVPGRKTDVNDETLRDTSPFGRIWSEALAGEAIVERFLRGNRLSWRDDRAVPLCSIRPCLAIQVKVAA
jgi:hypothetical protein